MKTRTNTPWLIIEQVIPWVILALLLTYSYAKFFRHSYGFRVDSPTGLVVSVFDEQPEPTLKENDRIIQIGSVLWANFKSDLSQPFFAGYKPGDTVPIVVERNGRREYISWKYPTFSRGEFFDQLNSEWWIAYFFWLAGVLTILFVRPKDDSWLTMSLFDFLTATWLIAGSGSSVYHIWYSAIVLRVAVWLCLPVYLHLHWVFPRPLGKLPSWLVVIVYGIAIFFAIAQALEFLPTSLYSLVFLVAVGGSLILLFIHIWRQPSIRRDFRLPIIVLIVSLASALIWESVDRTIGIPAYYGSVGLLSLSLLPLAYLYAAFRRRLSKLELRANRFFTIYLFIIMLVIVELPFVALADYTLRVPDRAVPTASVAVLMTTVACLWGYPAFQNFMDRSVLGIPLPSKRLLEAYSTHITTSLSLPELVRVLQEEVFPSLLIRQFAFLQIDQSSLNVLSVMGLNREPLPKEKDIPYLMDQSGFYRSPDLNASEQPYSWIRLSLPLKLGDQLLGFWLFGRRDPDDLYSQQEIPTFASLANVTAIALSNIVQNERFKSMYETNIDRYEQEKLRLAHDLHDSILNEMAALLLRGDVPNLPPKFQQAYDELMQRLREIVNGLRPPMLTFGLKVALEDFAEDLTERKQNSVEILTDIQSEGQWRYPEIAETNIYRIVQEACENALRHAHAQKLLIFGRLNEGDLKIKVDDDGIGFHSDIHLERDHLLANKHFGLAGMLERASLIEAELTIRSQPNQGTQIQIVWKSKESI